MLTYSLTQQRRC